jgi:hypothetical protein
MASTYSNIKIQLMATGENTTTWGDVTNVNLGTAIEEAIVGSADVAFSNDNVTLTLTDTNSTQAARNMRLNLTGTATTGYNLIVPAIEKPYIINNGTDGTITIKNSTGTGVAVPAGKTMWVYNNGTNVVDVVNHVTSLTTTGNAIINGNVGIGTSSPGAKLDVQGGNVRSALVGASSTTFRGFAMGQDTTEFASLKAEASAGETRLTSGFTGFGGFTTFHTNGAERMRIDSSGNVGIGTSAPSAKLQVSGAVPNTPTAFNVNHGASGNDFDYASSTVSAVGGINGGFTAWGTGSARAGTLAVGTGSNHPMTFMTNDTERMRITSGGNVGIGTSAPTYQLELANKANGLRVTGTNNGTDTLASFGGHGVIGVDAPGIVNGRFILTDGGNVGIGTSAPSAKLQVSGAVPNTPTTFNVNHGASGNDFDYASSTVSAVGGINGGFIAWGTGSARAGTLAVGTGSNHPMTFMTNDTERMRIDTGGNWLVGTTTLGAVGTVNGVRARPDGRAIISSAADGVLEVGYNGANATGTVVSFYKGGALGGSITTDGSTTAYNTASDYRLKNIDGPLQNSGAYIDALNPVQGNWKADGSRFIGLLAHEVQEVSETPIATGEKDGEEMQAMDYSAPELITNLIAEIQSLRARVAQLEGN